MTSVDSAGGEACHLASLRCGAVGAIFGCRACHGGRINPDHHCVGDLVREGLALAGRAGEGELDRVILLLDEAAGLSFTVPVKSVRVRIVEFCAGLD